MNAGTTLARPARARHRHELRTLTYVTLDQANGGVIRNLSRDGIAVQVVAAVRPRQQMRVRFELRYPRLRVEARGEVIWATFSGQCGIRFLDLTPRLARQIDEWIFGSLLEGVPLHSGEERPTLDGGRYGGLFAMNRSAAKENVLRGDVQVQSGSLQSNGLMVSAAPVKVIELSPQELSTQAEPEERDDVRDDGVETRTTADLDWLSRPLSSRSLAWTVNVLAVLASLLLFAVVFLSITRELPRWPWAMTGGAIVLMAGLYWGFFKLLGGSSPGARLARLAGYEVEEEEMSGARFR